MATAKGKSAQGNARKKKGEPQKASSSAIRTSYKKAAKDLEKMVRKGDVLYRIPWYAMVGEPDCGKESLLPDAGLSPRPGSPQTYGVEGPHANKWWFFSNAVVVDYGGVYFAGQDEKLDEEERTGFFARFGGKKSEAEGAWATNLKGLRTYRKRRPLDGLIVAIDVRTLLDRGPDALTRIGRRAEVVAERIHQAQDELGVHMPTYVMLTHCEALPGFDVFARAMPETMRDQMFGWSSPYDPETSYQPEWVDEAMGSVHEAICVTQLDLLPHVQQQADRDDLYLLPRHIAQLKGALKAYLDPIFKATSYRQTLPLRGIYLTALVGDEPPAKKEEDELPPIPGLMPVTKAAKGPKRPPRPAFVQQLFTEKIFREPGITRLDDEARRKQRKRVRWYRLAVLVVALIGLSAIIYQRAVTSRRVDQFGGLLKIIERYQERARYGVRVDEHGDGRGIEALEALAELEVDRFEMLTAPTSFFDNLTEDTNKAIAMVLGYGVARPLKEALEQKADALLPPGLEVAVGANGLEEAAPRRPSMVVGGVREGLSELGRFSKEVVELNLNFGRYNNHNTRDLAQLYLYVTGKDITKTLESTDGLYRNALQARIREWPELGYDPYANRARIKQEQMAQRFQDDLFRQNPLRDGLRKLAGLMDTIELRQAGETYAQRLTAINNTITEVEAQVDGGKANWLLPEEFKPGPQYADLIETLNGQAFPAAQSETDGELVALGTRFERENQKLFNELRQSVWGAETRTGGFRLLGQQEGKVVLSTELDTVKQNVRRFLSEPYVQAGATDQTEYQLGVARRAGLRDSWNPDLLREVLDWHAKYEAYTKATRSGVPQAVNNALDQAAARELKARLQLHMEYARPATLPGSDDGSLGWTAQRKEQLKERIRNLRAEHERIIKTIAALNEINRALNEPEDSELFNALRDDALGLLAQVDSLLTYEKLYQIRADDFSWADSDQPPGVVAFGARDTNDLHARLEVQRKTIQNLANDFARPLDEVITNIGEPVVSHRDVTRWKDILAVLDDFEKKVPGNSLEDLERFIEDKLNNIKLENCRKQLDETIDKYGSKDYFKGRKYVIATEMQRRCDAILKRETVNGYVQLQRYFAERLMGRFPFAGPDTLAEAETGEVVQFYKMFDQSAGAFAAMMNPDSGSARALFGDSADEVQRFLEQVQQVRKLFEPILKSEDQNPDLVLDTEFDFRVNRDNELGGNQIIDWYASLGDQRVELHSNKRSAQWRTNDQVGVCFRWALDADYIPAPNQRNEQARVNGREVCYVYAGRWSLLRLLLTHATTAADRGRRSFLRPHTLRFETETSSARGGAGLLATETRVYTRIGLQVPGEKSAFKLPDFPRRAPEVSKELLQRHGIFAGNDSKGGR
ncbi:MAG: hypothetical protein KC549_00240 [Myxococcales bacterium]|nr:hypothetical protein [Myxococcales bacterium]MCB9548704.1 hypothetical protein [Myxococcales bacterium]